MKKLTLFVFVGLICNSCENNNSVDRPYIISQSQAQEGPEETNQELD
jgi:hypothetical protein